MFRKANDPILVVVANGRWDTYGNVPATLRDFYLAELLKQMGGVNESVPEGRYHFNAKRRGLKIIASLTPINE